MQLQSRNSEQKKEDTSVLPAVKAQEELAGKCGPSWLCIQRLQELSVSIILLVISLLLTTLPVAQREIPDVNISVNGVPQNVAVMDVSYPVKVDGIWCSAEDIIVSHNGCGDGDKVAFQQIPNWLLIILGPFLSALTLVLLDQYCERRRGSKDDAKSSMLHSDDAMIYPYDGKMRILRDGMLGLFISMAIAGLLTNSLKQIVGRPRPNMRALLALDYPRYNKEAWKSFPSGHSSFAVATLHYLSLWKEQVLGRGIDLDDNPTGGTAKHCTLAYIAYLPTVLSLWLAATRVQDYWHHYSDVVAGCLIGFGAAHGAFRYVTRHAKFSRHYELPVISPVSSRNSCSHD